MASEWVYDVKKIDREGDESIFYSGRPGAFRDQEWFVKYVENLNDNVLQGDTTVYFLETRRVLDESIHKDSAFKAEKEE